MIKCKAAVQWEAGAPLKLEEVEVEPPKAGEVRVKIMATSICHSDIFTLYTPDADVHYPIVAGHESSGIVESVGDGVHDLAEGDHVLLVFKPQCQKCVDCKDPSSDTCMVLQKARTEKTLSDFTLRIWCRGIGCYQDNLLGTFSQYTTVPWDSLVKISKAASLEKICLLSCGFPTGYGSAVKLAGVRKGSSCAVWGMGAVGLSAVLGCKDAGADRIIGVDINNDKEKFAMMFGCTDFINSTTSVEPIDDTMKKMTNGRGLDHAIVCVGNKHCLEDALHSCRVSGGICVMLGLCDDTIEVSIMTSLVYGKILTGGRFGGYRAKDDLPGIVDKFMAGNYINLLVDQLITDIVPFTKIQEAVDTLKQGDSFRTIVRMQQLR